MLAALAYKHLISRKEYLFPDLTTIGNEIWLAIVAYLYVLSNHFFAGDTGAKRRRINYATARQAEFRRQFGDLLNTSLPNERWRLLAISILIVEDFNRPPIARLLERAVFKFGGAKTVGVMQVKAPRSLSDRESVRVGSELLVEAYREAIRSDAWRIAPPNDFGLSAADRFRLEEKRLIHQTLVEYNPSGDYARDIEATFERLLLANSVAESLSLHPDATTATSGVASEAKEEAQQLAATTDIRWS